jgi:hypothetical protein
MSTAAAAALLPLQPPTAPCGAEKAKINAPAAATFAAAAAACCYNLLLLLLQLLQFWRCYNLLLLLLPLLQFCRCYNLLLMLLPPEAPYGAEDAQINALMPPAAPGMMSILFQCNCKAAPFLILLLLLLLPLLLTTHSPLWCREGQDKRSHGVT